MTFAQPYWLVGLLLVPLLLGLIWGNNHRSRKRLEHLIAPRLLPELTDIVATSRRLLRQLLFLAALAGFLIAMARPQWGYVEQEVTQRGRDIVLAIDTSKSMLTQDVVPDRITRAKLVAQDAINAMNGDRFGVIAFAGNAQVEAPLTIDYQTAIDAVNDLSTSTVEKGGTNIAAAIRSAEFAFGKSESTYRALVLLTDGEDLDKDSVAAAKEARTSGIRIFAVGIGTREGGPIPLGPNRDQFVRDQNHQLVRSHLDEKRLQEITSQTGGFYVHLDPEATPRLLWKRLQRLDESNIDERSTRIPIERYRWPLAIGLFLLFFSAFLSDKRKSPPKSNQPALVAMPVVILALVSPLHANNALDLYEQGDFNGSLQSFRDRLKNHPNSPELNLGAGNAAFRLKEYDDAFENYSKAMRSSDLILREHAYYNAGNSLFLKGNNTKEIEKQLTGYYDARYQYQQALDLNPQDDQAKKNLRLLEERIKEAEQRKQEQQQQSQQLKPKKKRNQQKKDRGKQDQKSDQPNQPGDNGQPKDLSDDEDESKSEDLSDSGDLDLPKQQPTPKKGGQLQENTPPESESKSIVPPKDGKMSLDEALGLLNSLRDEGQRLDLSKKKRDRGVLRDW